MKGKFHVLTKYIKNFTKTNSYGEYIVDNTGKGTLEDPLRHPYVSYDKIVASFISDYYTFSKNHPEYSLTDYRSILENNGINLKEDSIKNVDNLNEQSVLALITAAIRTDRFREGTLLSLLENGDILTWLKRLKDIDESNKL